MPKKVLIIDDDENTVKFLSVALRRHGYEPIGAYDGKEGLERVADSSPDLIVLDIMMPKRTGWVVFRQLRAHEQHRSIPVIMLTAVSSVLKEQEATSSEDTDYGVGELMKKVVRQMREDGLKRPELFLDKPVDPEDLVGRVRDLIGT